MRRRSTSSSELLTAACQKRHHLSQPPPIVKPPQLWSRSCVRIGRLCPGTGVGVRQVWRHVDHPSRCDYFAQDERDVVAGCGRHRCSSLEARPDTLQAGIDAELQEVSCVLTTAGLGEVEDRGPDVMELCRAPGSHVGRFVLPLARFEDRHRCLIGVQHWHLQQFGRQRVHERPQLHAALADPLRARVERAMAVPARSKMASWRYSGRWSRYLATSTCASRRVVGKTVLLLGGQIPIGASDARQ